ncbi:hypothetical protein [Paraglaciecola marina]|uniref:hypothetical protein n=1 Tax=Paraglaciecola marina TaxID=2500157 RepID=UPI001061D445|nr:hypothetical protein [Paraglaciecola marina]
MRKLLISILLITFILTGCSTIIEKDSEEVIEISAEEFDAARVRFKNNSVSNEDLLMSVMQSVPVLPLGVSFETVRSELIKKNLYVIEESDDAILIKGNADIFSDIDVEVNSPINVFKYTFNNSLLTSGPNVVDN